jgi:hypothetical protein
MSKNPYAALFTNRVAAEAAANVRNALLVSIKGHGTDVEEVLDWYRRDEEGRPMPAEWRELMGQLHLQWHVKPVRRADAISPGVTATPEPAEA